MRKSCVVCGAELEAKRADRLYCGSRCSKRAQRQPKPMDAEVIPLAVALSPSDGRLAAATCVRLVSIGRRDSELGAAVLLLAKRLDDTSMVETGAGVAALMKEYRATLAEAVRD